MNNEEMKKKIEELEMKIKGLENDLDDMEQQLESANKVKRAVLEIQDFLAKKANGYEVDFHSYLVRLNK